MPLAVERDVLLETILVPDRTARQSFGVLEKRQPKEMIAIGLGLPEFLLGLEERQQKGLEDRPRPYDQGADPVHRGVEGVQSEVDPSQRPAPDDLLGQAPHLIVEDDDVVRVPADRAAEMEEQLIEELQ